MTATSRVALVEDDEDLRESTRQLLMLGGFAVDAYPAGDAALAGIDADYPGVVVTDVRMPGLSGIALFAALHARDAALPVILVTGHGDVAMAVDALKAGAWDFLSKPFDPEALVHAVRRAAAARGLALENRRLRAAAEGTGSNAALNGGLIGGSPAIRRLRDMIPMLADASLDLLVEGETGTGKALFARAVHRAGKRARHRFLTVACAAMPDALLDGELFARVGEGSVVAASRGTLFLDDVDRASLALQARLAMLVEARALTGARAGEAVPIDLRVIASAAEEAATRVTSDLFYRLAAVRVRMPPLRERREDVPALFAHFLGDAAARAGRGVPVLTQGVLAHLAGHDWPGNVRELAHYADRVVLGLEGEAAAETPAGSLPVRMAAFERAAIVEAMAAAGGEVGAAIARLGVPRKTFYYRVQKLGIDLKALRR